MQLTFLGTGTSHGIPIIGCNCPTCMSVNDKNKRFRSSIHLNISDKDILIDTPPELRLQLLKNDINNIDLILFTHAHADHIMGFDDIRAINRLKDNVIPWYGNQDTIDRLSNIFNYIFNPVQIGGGIPQVSLKKIDTTFKYKDLTITPLPVMHGKIEILGFKIKNLAYITDCSYIPENTYNLLKNIDYLVIDALRFKTHPTHMNIDEALSVIERLNLSRAYLTHISHEIEHIQVSKYLPDNVKLAYDGLKIEI
mgnify:CR=1 FL=1